MTYFFFYQDAGIGAGMDAGIGAGMDAGIGAGTDYSTSCVYRYCRDSGWRALERAAITRVEHNRAIEGGARGLRYALERLEQNIHINGPYMVRMSLYHSLGLLHGIMHRLEPLTAEEAVAFEEAGTAVGRYRLGEGTAAEIWEAAAVACHAVARLATEKRLRAEGLLAGVAPAEA